MPAAAAERSSKLRAWGELLRLPNLFTVPGDPMVGFLLSVGRQTALIAIVPAAGASLLLYASGLLSNDFFDAPRDRRERPGRPIPSGRVPRWLAGLAACALAAAGLAVARLAGFHAAAVAGVLLACVLAYNAGVKRLPVAGPVLMGACRGLSVAVGIAAAGADLGVPAAWIVPIWIAAYVASVTAIARHETAPRRIGWVRRLPPAILAFGFTFMVAAAFDFDPASVRVWIFSALALAAVVWAGRCAFQLAGRPEPARVQKTIGDLLRGLLIVQAALAVATGWIGPYVAAALVLAWPASALLARRFYAS